jgi:hypothetical protein
LAVGPDTDWRAVASVDGVRVEVEDIRADAAIAAIKILLKERSVERPVGAGPMAPMKGFKRRRVRWRDA